MHKAITFFKMERARQLLIIEAIAALALARVWLSCRTFKSVAGRLGHAGVETGQAGGTMDDRQVQAARQVRWALGVVAPHVPFRAVCLQQAVAARLMLARRNIPATVRFGLVPSGGPRQAMRAEAGTMPICGFPLEDALVTVARFD